MLTLFNNFRVIDLRIYSVTPTRGGGDSENILELSNVEPQKQFLSFRLKIDCISQPPQPRGEEGGGIWKRI